MRSSFIPFRGRRQDSVFWRSCPDHSAVAGEENEAILFLDFDSQVQDGQRLEDVLRHSRHGTGQGEDVFKQRDGLCLARVVEGRAGLVMTTLDANRLAIRGWDDDFLHQVHHWLDKSSKIVYHFPVVCDTVGFRYPESERKVMAETQTQDLLQELAVALQEQIERFEPTVEAVDIGTVVEVGDGIARASGLANVLMSELVEFEGGVTGIAFDLEADNVGIIITGDYKEIEEGQTVQGTGRIVSVPVGDALLGRVVDALGRPVDGKGPITTDKYRPIERIAPGVVERQNVDTPVQTGIKPIDAMIPIGRGQRELIIGDRQTGKTAIALDSIINQRGKDLVCIYVAVGQRKGQVAQVVATLERYGALDHTIVVVASASEPAALQYIAPYAGCAMGEEFMEQGRDALIIYDDLTKHAWAYRQVSLLLRRPPGREAYPGDIFYLHSRLLERAARLHDDRGGGSLTALPIIETQLGDMAAYIPTNVISITDGQIYLEGDLFNAGIRPAINVGVSVSRVGGDAQTKAMKQVAGQLRLEMAQFRELAAFAQFGSDLDEVTLRRLERGRRLTEILKQPQYEPVPLEEQVIAIYAGTHGYCDGVPVTDIRQYEQDLAAYMRTQHPEIGVEIAAQKAIAEETEAKLRAALDEFRLTWLASRPAEEETGGGDAA
jgi:F-type H+-transporting ATPase subunit alpha